MSNLHISISAEPVFHIGSVAITNSILTSWLVTLILIAVSLWASKNVKVTKRPKGLQNFLEMLVEGLHGLTLSITESPLKTKTIFPFVFSFFLFIILNNWIGLLPGVGTIGILEEGESHASKNPPYITQSFASAPAKTVQNEPEVPTQEGTVTPDVKTEEEVAKKFVPIFRPGTADLNTTLALALISVIATQVIGIKFLGLKYFQKFINFHGPIDFFVGILEMISEVSKIISFAFRLFGNVFAGEVLLAVMAFLVPLLIPSVFIGLEIFVGAIQAFVFATLTLVFMNLASTGHESPDHEVRA